MEGWDELGEGFLDPKAYFLWCSFQELTLVNPSSSVFSEVVLVLGFMFRGQSRKR